jgi:hypothetical protein
LKGRIILAFFRRTRFAILSFAGSLASFDQDIAQIGASIGPGIEKTKDGPQGHAQKGKTISGHSRGFTGGEKMDVGQEIYRLKREGGGEAFR